LRRLLEKDALDHPTNLSWPLRGRWDQCCENGKVNWFLGALCENQRFWGYAHFRTTARHENRNYSGLLGLASFERIRLIIEPYSKSPAIVDQSNDRQRIDGRFGAGAAHSWRSVIEIRYGESTTAVVDAFNSIVGLLQPAAFDAIDWSEGHNNE
jgi:hypothetical protein